MTDDKISAYPIYVVDDDKEFRESVVALIAAEGRVIREFSSTCAFVKLADALPPGILLLDLRMPGTNGVDFLENATCLTKFGVIIVSGDADIEAAVRSMKAGALGLIEKPFTANELFTKLSEAAAGLMARANDSGRKAMCARMLARLSARERDVLKALLSGESNKETARALGLSVRTVEMHRARLMYKLDARTVSDAVRIAFHGGWAVSGD